MGEVKVPSQALWGAQTQRSLVYFSIGQDLMPRELIGVYAILKKACALANRDQKGLSQKKAALIIKVCDEISSGMHQDQFPLRVWMTGSGTQFNMNVNEVIANRCSQIERKPLGSKTPIHPNDDVNMSQSSNDSFPAAMNIAAAVEMHKALLPAVEKLQASIDAKAKKWKGIVKLGRTHMQDATPLTLGQEFSGYAEILKENLKDLKDALVGVYPLALGGTAVGTGINTIEGFDKRAAAQIARLTKLPFCAAKNKFAVQGSHNRLVHLSGALRCLAVSLYKIANDIRLLSCGPRAGFYELIIPSNEPGSSIMPGKVNPTQCEALSMVALQVMGNDVAAGFGDASGYLEMNVYKPLIIHNILHSIRILSDACVSFEKFLIKGMEPNKKQIKHQLERSLMLVTALSPKIGYEKASQIAHHAFEHDLTLKEAALELQFITEQEFDRLVDPLKMCFPKKSS